MDLDAIIEYKREHGLVNETDDDDDFIRDNPHVAIPYLIMICLAMTAGTVGNFFIIGAVLVERVRRQYSSGDEIKITTHILTVKFLYNVSLL